MTFAKAGTLAVCSFLLFQACARQDNAPVSKISSISGAIVHPLSIRNYVTTTFSDAQADAITGRATQIFQSFKVSLVRQNVVQTYNVGNGTINSNADFNAVFSAVMKDPESSNEKSDAILGAARQVRVLNQINWCGQTAPNIIGCADTPGIRMVVVPVATNIDGVLWGHEFGHTKGLPHRNDTNALMNGVAAPTNTLTNGAEQNALRQLGLVSDMTNLTTLSVTSRSAEEFVHNFYIHGIPYAEAAKFGESDVPILLRLLDDPKETKFWPNIVVVLGIIGSSEAVVRLIKFVEEEPSQQGLDDQYRAITSAIMSLGYAINKTGDAVGLEYLANGLRPEIWKARRIKVKASYQRTEDERNKELVSMAVLGLALSGNSKAGLALRQFQQELPSLKDQEFSAMVKPTVDEALATHSRISKDGLAKYYDQSHHPL